jgi:hypothetical protein
MYLVSQEYMNKSKLQSSPKFENKMPQCNKETANVHEKCFRMRNRMFEKYINRKLLIPMTADFVQRILPINTTEYRYT